MFDNFLKKAKYGILINLAEYIQIPILEYKPGYNINENPYIRLDDIHSDYKLVKGKTGEISFWEKVKFMFEDGKVDGFEDEKVYPINEKQAIVEINKNHATYYFWGPDYGSDDNDEWLWKNAEEYELHIDGNPTNYFIYIMDINKIKN